MPKREYQPPPRKEPGLIGNSITSFVRLIAWLFVSLLISIAIEWIGIAFIWPEQGEYHSQQVLMSDQVYLNSQAVHYSGQIKTTITKKTISLTNWIRNESWIQTAINWARNRSPDNASTLQKWANELYHENRAYVLSSVTVTQIFVVRLVLILFSLPAFGMFAIVGAVDGLVERDLRRWGGGRESSNVYNLARKSIVPAFILACVVYISLPFSISPLIVVLPFSVLLGLSVRIAFDRLKKYF